LLQPPILLFYALCRVFIDHELEIDQKLGGGTIVLAS
jgi:hypothetical protein